jgi:hypothetical protein
VRYHPDVVQLTTELVTEQPEFAMGHVLAAYLSLTSTDAPDLSNASASAVELADLRLTAQETAHAAAIERWLGGDWHGAARTLDALLVEWPDDILALLVGHQLDFFRGDAANLRDRVARSIGRIDPASPSFGFVQGMFAFGLEESGDYQAAERRGLAAVAAHPEDVWAIHAVTHVYEMQGRVDEGISFLRSREADWGSGNMFTVHNWWHLALYLLEADRVDDALDLYDARIHNSESAGVPIEMLDASALLWRLFLEGQDTGGRFGPLADAWATRSGAVPWYAFNDLHAVMALVGAGRFDDANLVIDGLDRYVAAGGAPEVTNVTMTAEIGLPASRAVVAIARGDYAAVIEHLLPIRKVFQHFGGSHAQRDALQRTLLTAAIRSGELDLADALVSERIALRESSVYGLTHAAEIAAAKGDGVAASAYERAAAANRERFSAVT